MGAFVAYILHSNIINLAAVAAILVWIVKKFNLVDAVTKKIDEIKTMIQTAEKQREKAIEELKSAKNRVKNIESERKEITSEAQKTADLFKEKIEVETLQSLKDIEKNTEKFLDAEQKMMKESMSTEVAKEALEIAKTHIKQAINNDMQKKYINDFIDSLDGIKV